jgi:hypothetical protein
MAWSSIISDAMWLYPEGRLWDDAYKNNPRPHKLASKHTHTLIRAVPSIYQRELTKFFLRGGGFSTTWQLCLKVQGVYLQFILQHAVLHYSHLSLAFHGFVLFGFANSRGRPKNKVHHSDPSVDRSIRIVGRLEQVFEPYRMSWRETSSSSYHSVVAKKRKKH